MSDRVTRGLPAASGGKSHSCDTPRRSSSRPRAPTISVAAGRRETIFTGRPLYPAGRLESAPPTAAAVRLLLDDVLLEAGDRAEDFVLLLLRDLELVERRDEVLHRGLPVGLRDAEPRVDRLHVPADVDARAAGGTVQLVDDELAQPAQGILAVAGEEVLELLVRGETADEIIGDGGESVVAAEPLVEARSRRGRTLRLYNDRDGEREKQ